MTLKENNLIQAAAEKTNTKVAVKSPAQRMREVLNMNASQSLMGDVLRENKESFVASLIDLYGSDNTLAQCDAGAVMREALKAVSLKLPINKQLGFAYIIPYAGTPTFILGYKGLLQLCMRTGAYRHINAGPVYEGELQSIDKLRGDVDLSGEATSDKVVGYFAYIETLNGFAKALYWPMDKLMAHAKKYSKNFNGQIWQQNFDEMATKTVLRYLLSHWGVMSVDMVSAMSVDNTEQADNAIVSDGTVTDQETGEITPATGSVE